jgi:hypothetical protein
MTTGRVIFVGANRQPAEVSSAGFRPKQADRHTCSGKLGIVRIFHYISSDMYTAFFGRKIPPLPPDHRGPVLKQT